MENYKKACRTFRWAYAEKEIDFFEDGKINAAHNAVDRHAKNSNKDKTALYWQGEKTSKKFTFKELSELSNQFANTLKRLGTKKGDRVFIFLPRVPELYISFLGILKTGAIAGTMFAAFGTEALLDRLENSEARFLVTNNELKKRVYKIIKSLPHLEKIITIDDPNKPNEIGFWKRVLQSSTSFNAEKMDPDEPAFLLYTSGSTGKPKGILHAHRSIIQHHLTSKWVLDLKENDVLWCTADPGWVTGIAYGILGPWSNATSQVVYSGRFDPKKWYGLIEKHKVTVWYTAPTAVRMLEKAGDKPPKKYNLKSLRHMCSVGEPLNPEPIKWGLKVFKLPFHDNWWQTETGGILIANYPSMDIKLGSMGKPVPGIKASITDDNGNELGPKKEGNLVIKPPWPGMMLGVWKDPKKYASYFKGDWYLTGDKAYKDKAGYFWFVGRADDVIKTAGERIGPFEVESALTDHPAIVEAGVVGKPDKLRGEIIKAFVVLKPAYSSSLELKENIKAFVKKHLAGHAYPRDIEFVKELPKTQSGKILRRVLKAKETGKN